MTRRHFLPDGTECDETGLPILPMTIPEDGSPPIRSNPGSGVDLNTGKMVMSKSCAALARELNWRVPTHGSSGRRRTQRRGDRYRRR